MISIMLGFATVMHSESWLQKYARSQRVVREKEIYNFSLID